MSVMTYNGYSARVEFDADDEIFHGTIAGIRDVVGFHADTVADLKAAFHEAVDDYLAACAKIGKQPDKEFKGSLMLRIKPETHRAAAVAAQAQGKSLNQWADEALSRAAN